MDDRELLQDNGKVSAEQAKEFAESEFEKYRIVQDRLFMSDFDKEIEGLLEKKDLMDLLTIQHEDFTMYIECTKFDAIWNKAKGNVGEENLLSTYTWSEGVVDMPPDDAINQMHRYRDAIYYRDYSAQQLKKEVIGGYILFPGDGEPADVEVSKFYKTISEVNIGAFPLRPKDERNRQLLEHFIHELIAMKSASTIAQVIPQKGAFVEVGDRVLIGVVRPSSRKDYNKSFEEGRAKLYYTGRNFPSTIMLHNLHFFIPYFPEKGIRDVYEITGVRTITARDAKQLEGAEVVDDIRLAFELTYSRNLSEDFLKINTKGMIKDTFIDTTFENIPKIIDEE